MVINIYGNRILVKKNMGYQTQLAFTCSKVTIETLEQGLKYLCYSFEDVWHFVLVFLLLTLSRYMPAGKATFGEKNIVL